MRKGIAGNFNAFKSVWDDGLMGPSVHELGIDKANCDLTLAMTNALRAKRRCRQSRPTLWPDASE
jgi:hypothetical protein